MGKNIWFHGKKNLKSSSFMAQDKHTKEGEKGEKEKGFKPTQNLKATSCPRRKPTP
jgi:hypothetical protein